MADMNSLTPRQREIYTFHPQQDSRAGLRAYGP